MPDSRWHFSGNFWWVHIKTLFKRDNWKFIYKHTHAVESYLGAIFKFEEAYNMTYTMKDLDRYHHHAIELVKDYSNKPAFQAKRSSKLFCIITGMENSGTTVLSHLVMSAPGVFGAFECGMLLAEQPKNFENVSPFYGWMQVRNRENLLWNVSAQNMKRILSSPTHLEMYDKLHVVSDVMKPDEMIVDKTPAYVYQLRNTLDRTNGEVPIVVIRKKFDNQKASWHKRGVPVSSVIEAFVRAHKSIDEVADEPQVIVVDYEKLSEQIQNVFSFLNLEWKSEYLSMEAYNKKLLPFKVTAAAPAKLNRDNGKAQIQNKQKEKIDLKCRNKRRNLRRSNRF